MGLSLSSLSIDKQIEQRIYFPPKINKELYQTLTSTRSMLLNYQTKTGKNITAVQIRPTNNTFPEKYIVFSHGNGSDIYTMFQYLLYLSDELNVGIIGYDYVGYGLSENIQPSEQDCYDSIEATVDFLLTNWKMDPKKIFLVGQSLGTGITVDYASKHKWDTPIILISPYKSICKVVKDTFLTAPIDKFKSQKKLKYVTCPVKIFHGTADEIIKINHGIEMYDSLKNKTLEPVWFCGIDHHNILDVISKEHYLQVLNYNA